jgi:hypothetical protein
MGSCISNTNKPKGNSTKYVSSNTYPKTEQETNTLNALAIVKNQHSIEAGIHPQQKLIEQPQIGSDFQSWREDINPISKVKEISDKPNSRLDAQALQTSGYLGSKALGQIHMTSVNFEESAALSRLVARVNAHHQADTTPNKQRKNLFYQRRKLNIDDSLFCQIIMKKFESLKSLAKEYGVQVTYKEAPDGSGYIEYYKDVGESIEEDSEQTNTTNSLVYFEGGMKLVLAELEENLEKEKVLCNIDEIKGFVKKIRKDGTKKEVRDFKFFICIFFFFFLKKFNSIKVRTLPAYFCQSICGHRTD